MERKIVVICIAALLTGVLTVQGQHMDGLVIVQEISEEQALRECTGLPISPEEQAVIDRIWAEQTGYEREQLSAADCAILGGPGTQGTAQRVPGANGAGDDWLFIRCWADGRGKTYELLDNAYNKCVQPAARDVTYQNWNNTDYTKYMIRPVWPWTDA